MTTPEPEVLPTPTSSSGVICGPPQEWTIQYSRSGGFAGFNESLTLQSDGTLIIQSERPPADVEKTIPEKDVAAITNLIVQACPFKTSPGDTTCADCSFYDLQIRMDDQTYVVSASDVTLTDELHPLIDALNPLLQSAAP